ncbi:hypothetical protein MMC26_000377 [Xylographa opegraphella]|nr:hypothetical protein [Xylographa opegraphella]
MGKLLDVTSSTDTLSNMNSRWSPNTSEAFSDTEQADSLKPSPRFMSPTIASRVAALGRAPKRNSAPSSMSSKKSKTSSWMASAAKRVSGKSQKRSPTTPDAAVPHDKTTRTSGAKMSESRNPMYSLNTKPLPSEKPLPAHPIAQVIEAEPVSGLDRGIIDALEKPLTRSPPGEPNNMEEWPVLNPEKPVPKSEIHELDSRTCLRARLPRLLIPGKDCSMTQDRDLDNKDQIGDPSINNSAFSYSIPPRAALLTGMGLLQPESTCPTSSDTKKNLTTDTKVGQSVVECEVTQALNIQQSPVPVSRIPQAIVHKSSRAQKPPPVPRQTRTSNLRAGLASSNAEKNNPINTTTTSTKSKPAEQTVQSSHAIRGKSYPDGCRAPTKMVPGSRRSSRDFRQGSQVTLPESHSISLPTGPSPRKNSLKHGVRACVASENGQVSNMQAVAHESTNGKYLHEHTQYYELDDTSPSSPTGTTLVSTDRVKHTLHHEFAVYEEPSKQVAPIHNNGMDVTVPSTTNTIDNEGPTPLTGQASRTRAYTMKRLSRFAPTHGPTLWISHSADRLIMGQKEFCKENVSSSAIKNKDLRCMITGKEFRKSRDGPALRPHTVSELNRPVSSQGLVRSDSQRDLDSSEFRKKRSHSISIDYSLRRLHLQHDVVLNGASSRSTVTSIGDDPFFDARSHLEDARFVDGRSEATSQHKRQSLYEDAIVGESSWISSLPERALSIKPRRAPSTVSRLKVATNQDDPNPVAVDSTTENDNKDEKPTICQEQALKTPARAERDTAGSPEIFPPRSSSHTPVPDFTLNEPAFSDYKKYPAKGTMLLQGNVDQDSTRTTSFRSQIAGYTSYGGSTTQESTISLASTSKSVFSNVRGFFHKRASDKGLLGTSSKKTVRISKAHINSKGSPSLPVPDAQRLDRTTVFSKNRNASKSDRAQPTDIMLDTPVLESPRKSELSNNTALAMDILETARHEPSSPKKERLLELGKIMVNALTQARDAEKAMEEAKQAARKAEISYMLCTKSVSEIAKSVQDWRLELGRAG